MRFLLILLLVLLAAWWWRQKKREKTAAPPTEQVPKAVPMVHCQTCGLHLPQTDAIASQGVYFCSTEHQQRVGP